MLVCVTKETEGIMPEQEATTVEATQRPISGKWTIDMREAGVLHQALSAANPTQGGSWLAGQLDSFIERAELALERGDGEFSMHVEGAHLRVVRPAVKVDPETGQTTPGKLDTPPLPESPDAIYSVDMTITLGSGERVLVAVTDEGISRWGAPTAALGATVDVSELVAQYLREQSL